MQTEYRLRVPPSFHADVRGEGFRFCRDSFERVVHLPADVRECFLVVSDAKPQIEDYRITKPIQDVFGLGLSSLTRIKGHPLYYHTRKKLAELYDQGYRSVSIQYEN